MKGKKYVLKSTTKYVGTTRERPIDDFVEEDFKRYEDGKLSDTENQQFTSDASEDQGFEWWIEEAKEEDE